LKQWAQNYDEFILAGGAVMIDQIRHNDRAAMNESAAAMENQTANATSEN
jgi:hypothetical protein